MLVQPIYHNKQTHHPNTDVILEPIASSGRGDVSQDVVMVMQIVSQGDQLRELSLQAGLKDLMHQLHR
jgi:hypothetical protein